VPAIYMLVARRRTKPAPDDEAPRTHAPVPVMAA
jgi:hypothetical protein